LAVASDLNRSLRAQPDIIALPAVPVGTATTATEQLLLRELDTGRAALPVLPRIASQALKMIDDPDTGVAEFADLVQGDPPISALFLGLANSAAYSRGMVVQTVHAAVGRVGLAGARDVILQVAYGASVTGLRWFQSAVRDSYERGVNCGLLCRVAASVLGLTLRDAYVYGLLHDIGESRIYRILSQMDPVCSDQEAAALVRKYHPRAGAELARKWHLPAEIVRACGEHESLATPPSDALRLVRLSDLLVPFLSKDAEANLAGDELLPDALEALSVPMSAAQKILNQTRALRG
jgi:HD-like signal output (HDOD) protein